MQLAVKLCLKEKETNLIVAENIYVYFRKPWI